MMKNMDKEIKDCLRKAISGKSIDDSIRQRVSGKDDELTAKYLGRIQEQVAIVYIN